MKYAFVGTFGLVQVEVHPRVSTEQSVQYGGNGMKSGLAEGDGEIVEL
jgi:hypothetical protein